MKLDKLPFARLIGFCIGNGMDSSSSVIEEIDRIVDFNLAPTYSNVNHVNELLEKMMTASTGNLIEAIKAYGNLTGQGLKESKEAIERYRVSAEQFEDPIR
jgi:ribosomal protein L7/L12